MAKGSAERQTDMRKTGMLLDVFLRTGQVWINSGMRWYKPESTKPPVSTPKRCSSYSAKISTSRRLSIVHLKGKELKLTFMKPIAFDCSHQQT